MNNTLSELSNLFEPYVWEWFQQTYAEPSPPQVQSWPRIAEGHNTLIFSPTGSGKTLASFLWCINALFQLGEEQELDDSIYVLYVSPLKALNNDIQKNLVAPLQGIFETANQMGYEVPQVRSAVRAGDTTSKQRAAMARRPPHILITTPESLFIMLSTDKFRHAFSTLRYVIVDEIHAISDNKRGVHLSLALERLQHFVASDLVRIGLSATQNPLDEIARFLVGLDAQGNTRPCEIVDVGGRKQLDVQVLSPVDNLMEAHFDAIWGSSYDMLLRMIAEHDTTLIFANSRYKTERTALRLNELADGMPIEVGSHHGSMSKKVRLQMENNLKQAKLDALVATSSLELGIDVGSIDLVCQLQSPKSVSSGMQRIGRAGHLLDVTSKGRLLVVDRDDLVESVVLVNAIYEGDIDTTRIPHNCLDVLAQHIVGAVAADPWAVDALREAKLRQPDTDDDRAASDDVLLINIVDPANPYGYYLPLTDAAGEEIKLMKVPTRYLILQAGRPVMVFEGAIRVLDDLTHETAEKCIHLLTQIIDEPAVSEAREEIFIRRWNGHPTEVSPARHLLMDLGFYRVQTRHKVYVYDGTVPEDWDRQSDPGTPPDVFYYAGKEKAPIVYDADWVISQAAAEIRPKVSELIAWLKARVNEQCTFIYRPRYFKDFQVLYRGMRCINPHIQLKKIRLQVKYKGWDQGQQILPETDLNAPEFIREFDTQFAATCAEIDADLDGHT